VKLSDPEKIMPLSQQVIQWPAAIHYDNDAEMQLVENVARWQQISNSRQDTFEVEDYLVDSHGQVFFFSLDSAGNTLLNCTDKKLSLEKVLGLVKAHLADQGSCCVAKLYAPSIRDALQMLCAEGQCEV